VAPPGSRSFVVDAPGFHTLNLWVRLASSWTKSF
jgi:hypothetical protein